MNDSANVNSPTGEPLMMEPGSIYALGFNMSKRLVSFQEKSLKIGGSLQNYTRPMNQGEVKPLGQDPRWVHVQSAVSYHTEAMDGNHTLIDNFYEGMDRVSRLTRIITHEIGGVDAQNAMTMKDLEEKTGLNDDNAYVVDYSLSPSDIDDNATGLPPHIAPGR